jgi:hypothetical protein
MGFFLMYLLRGSDLHGPDLLTLLGAVFVLIHLSTRMILRPVSESGTLLSRPHSG